MDLAFGHKQLRAICLESKVATRTFGMVDALALASIISDLTVAERVDEMVDAQWINETTLEIRSETLILRATQNHQFPPLRASGAIDFGAVSQLKIVEIIKC